VTTRIEPVRSIPRDLLVEAEDAAGGAIRSDANVYRTLANHPPLFVAWMALGGHLLRASVLSARLRELVILRTVLLANGRYPAVQHRRLARSAGVSDDEIALLSNGLLSNDLLSHDLLSNDPAAGRWDRQTGAALRAVDQLLALGTLDDTTLITLTDDLGVDGTLDLIATVAFYRMASWMLNACRTPLDGGELDEDPSAEPTVAERPDARSGPKRAGPTTSNVGIDPLPVERWPADLLERTASWPRFAGRPELRQAGVYRTLAAHPPLFAALGPVMAHLLVGNSLSDQHRELVIVRSCLLDRGAYPYRQHVAIAAAAGVEADVLSAVTKRNVTLDDASQSALVAAIDDLHRIDDIADSTWSQLAPHFTPSQTMDAIVTAGFYGLISFVLNSARTPLEPSTVELPPAPFEKGTR
jgi:alkylhydroperoxidase family enzyme